MWESYTVGFSPDDIHDLVLYSWHLNNDVFGIVLSTIENDTCLPQSQSFTSIQTTEKT